METRMSHLPALRRLAVLVATLLALATSALALGEEATPGAGDRPTVLITGANRGIGFEFARQLAEAGWEVIATARQPAEATELRALAGRLPTVHIEAMDVTDHAGVDALAAKYRGRPIDVLLLNAAQGPKAASAFKPLAGLEFDEARRSFEVNAIGPLKVAQAFMPQVAASKRRLVVAMSSDSGSLEASFRQPVLYHYKASKAALNMYFHTLSFETPRKGVTVVMLHPGTVKTSPAMARFPDAMDTPVAVEKMLQVIERLGPADNGRFLDYQGRNMPW